MRMLAVTWAMLFMATTAVQAKPNTNDTWEVECPKCNNTIKAQAIKEQVNGGRATPTGSIQEVLITVKCPICNNTFSAEAEREIKRRPRARRVNPDSAKVAPPQPPGFQTTTK